MKQRVLGMEADIRRVIHNHSARCLGCTEESPRCVKLYKQTGNNATVCVELKQNEPECGENIS